MVTHEMRVRVQGGGGPFVIGGAEVDHWREILSLYESSEHFNTVPILTVHTAQENDVVSGAAELVR